MFGAKTPFGGGSGFGATTSAFGQQSTPFGASSGGLFGSKTPAAGAFGTPSFGSTTPASGGLFGGTSTNNNIFGAKPTQTSTGFGGFGSTGTTSGGLFGGGGSSLFQTPQSSSNAFGAKSTGFGGFGSGTSTFGTSTTSTGGLFGGTSAATGGSVFGQSAATNGTTVKFVPVTSTEQTQKSGVSMTVKTQNQCITVMDQYKEKSVEELRLEDYTAGRKGGGTTSAFGVTAPATGGLFGSTTGGTTGTSLFGSTAATKPSGFGGFGTTGTTGSMFGQPSGGLFGAKTTQSSLFGSTTTTTQSGFGGFGATSTGGLFGNTNTTGTSLFGKTAATQSGGLFGSTGFGTTAPSTGGLFGGTSAFGQPAASSSSLFGATSKPSFGFGASSGTGFGTNNTLSFGAASSGGLFGNTQAKPALSFGGFGNTATSGFGGFGTTAASTGGSLFGGGTTGGLFGNKTTGFGTTGFGTSTGATGSLFGATAGAGATGFGFGAGTQNTGLAGANMGGLSNVDQSTLAALRQQQIIQQQLKAIANTPFGDSPLFRNLTDASKTKKSQTSTGFTTKEPLASSQYKVLARPAAKVKPRPISSPSLGKSRLFDGLEDEGDFSPHPLQPRRSIKKLVIKNKTTEDFDSPGNTSQLKLRTSFNEVDDDLVAPSPEVIKTKKIDHSASAEQTKTPVFDNTLAELIAQEKTPQMKKVQNYILSPLSPSLNEDQQQQETCVEDDEEELSPCQIALKRAEYYTQPNISTLDKQVVNGQCLVRDFTVGRVGYGEVKFLGITDVFGLNLDKIVFFRRREAEVYPDDYPMKPEVGQELNKPSEITLLKVWPNDKSSHTPVKEKGTPQDVDVKNQSPQRLKACGFIERIEEKTLAMDAVFVDYRPDEGAWVFKVNHFTRYGMQEEYIEEAIDIEKRKRLLREKVFQRDDIDFEKEASLTDDEIKMRLHEKLSQMKDSPQTKGASRLLSTEQDLEVTEEEEEEMEDDEEGEIIADYTQTDAAEQPMEDDFLPMSHQLGHVARIKPFTIQGMKTSVLYDDDENDEDTATPKTLFKSKQIFSNKSIFSNTSMVKPKHSPFPLLDRSSNIQTTLNNPNESLNTSVFQNIITDGREDEKVKVQKKNHLFKSGLFAQNKSYVENQPEIVPQKDKTVLEENLFIKCRSYGLIPYENSLMFGRTSLLADAALTHAREYHTRWSNQSTFVHTADPLGILTQDTKKQTANIFSRNFLHSSSGLELSDNKVHIESIKMGENEGIVQYIQVRFVPFHRKRLLSKDINLEIQECLELSLKYAEFEEGDSTILKKIKLKSPVEAIADCANKAKLFKEAAIGENALVFETHSGIWDLMAALWGKQEIDDTGSLYEIHSARREALSKWLSQSVESDIKKEIEKKRVEDNGHLSVIFSLLCGNQVSAACDVARENKEMRLAFLLSQISGDHHLKHYIRNQLNQWDERNIDVFIHENRLKLYTLLSGMMVWKSTNNFINICDGLAWKRCLALHLWYYCASTATIFDAFTEYQNAFKGTDSYDAYAAYPLPPYDGLSEENHIKDLSYHLLALYCKRAHSLEKMLTPKSHTSNPLDYHLSWHLQQVLDELGYNHMSDERHTFLQHNYAAQLENAGLWHWAIFILMHLKDDSRREHYVKDVLNRYCRLSEDNSLELTTEEEMLVNKFHVPIQWLHEAKALHAKYCGEYHAEAVHLIRADRWDKAHTVILEHLAADAIVEEDYESLKDLLQDVSLPERCCTVKNWRIGGQIFLDFILLKEKLESIKTNKNLMNSYHLEDMEAEIASIINRISLMKVETAKERKKELHKTLTSKIRLAQSEMARTCSNMLKIVFSLLNSTDNDFDDENPKWSSMKVVPYVVDLPLPPDYYLKELRELLANFANEVENQENNT